LDIRSTRATRPGRAGADPDRGVLYAAALRQFEDLLTSAEAAGYAGRPVPLFYALSQAGRAIVAAFGDNPTVDGHGLRERRTFDATVGLLARQVDRASTKHGTDAFRAVAAAIGSSVFTGSASLGSIWAATPGASDLLLCDWDASWCPPLLACLGVRDEHVGVALYATGNHARRPIGLDEIKGPRYPRIPDAATIEDSWGFGHLPGATYVATASWDPAPTRPEEELRGRLARTRTDLHDDALLLSSVNDESDAMHPLMSWWALLFALSILARYHPTTWVSSLDPDRSELAVPLQALLDIAPDALAALVWEAVFPEDPEPLTIFSSKWTRLSAEERARLDRAEATRGDRLRGLKTT
jgi:hypothetical protein